MIRWIRERLGTAPYNDINLAGCTIVDVRDLVDKAGNPAGAISKLVLDAVRAYQAGETVVVACDFGISRSNAIAAGVLSVVEEMSYSQALRDVAERTGEREIKIDVATAVAQAFGATERRPHSARPLITGASGFLGGALLRSLGGRHDALGPSRSELDLEAGTLALAEYCDRESVGQIVHLAYPRAYTNTESAAKSMLMLRNILDVCRSRDIRLILVSGAVVFSGYTGADLVADEGFEPCPKGVYGETKFIEETLVSMHSNRGDVRSVVCRLSSVYGPGGQRPRFIHTFFRRAMLGETIVTHRYENGRPAVDLLFIDDAVDALRLVIDSEIQGVVHFGSGHLDTTFELAKTIVSIAGADVRVEELAIAETTANVALNSSRALHELHWSSRVNVPDGLARTLLNKPSDRQTDALA